MLNFRAVIHCIYCTCAFRPT